MKSILNIIKFELKQRVPTWVSLIFFVILVFQAIWYTQGTFEYYTNDGVLMNAPVIMYRNYSGMGMLMVIIIAIVTGGVLYKDIQYKSAQWYYAFPLNEKHFFIGRFLAAFAYLFILSLGLFVGNLLLPVSGIGAASRFGSFPIAAILHAILIFMIPNFLFFISLIFTLVVFTKKMAAGYLGAFILVIFFLVCQSSYEGNGNVFFAYLEPIGYVAVQYYYDHVSTAMKNDGLMQIENYLIVNRLIYLSVTAILFFISYRKFNFKEFISTSSKKKLNDENTEKKSSKSLAKLPEVTRSFTQNDFIKKLMTLSKVEILNIIRPVSFKIIIGTLMLMIFLQNVMFNANYYIGDEIPLTSNMTFFRLAWSVFIIMLLMIWSGELLFKEKTVKIWQITDSLPVPVWVTHLSKFIAMGTLTFILCTCFVLIGILTQLIMGRPDLINMSNYIVDVFGYRWGFLNFLFYISLVFFVGGITGNRFLTHILSVAYFLFYIISFDLGILEEVRYAFGFTPGVEDFSEMSKYGIFTSSANWFALLWAVLSVVLVMMSILFWRRGKGTKWYGQITKNQLSIISKAVMGVLLGVFVWLQIYLNNNLYANGNFISKDEREQSDADYERKYGYLKQKELPKYKALNLVLNYHPDIRKIDYNANITLSKASQDTLFLTFKEFVKPEKIVLNNQILNSVVTDKRHNVFCYAIPKLADSIFNLNIKATKQYIGLSQSSLESDITKNGSYASFKDFLPVIGYDSDKELDENRIREDNGLEKWSSRMATINDKKALSEIVGAEDALKIKGTITISTPDNQIPIVPGILINKDQQNGRNYFTYQVEKPSVFDWYVGVADYKNFLSETYQNTKLAIYANPTHESNIEIYEDALKSSLVYFKSIFKSYNFKSITLFEKHHWSETNMDAFANNIVISEKYGWVANSKNLAEKAYIYETVAAQLAKLWLKDNLTIANVQGADMLSIALPEVFAMDYLKRKHGEEAVKYILKKKKDKYGKDRNNEPNMEQPLIFADGIEYLEYNKGAIALYKMMESMGRDTFFKIIDEWVTQEQSKPVVFKNLYDILIQQVPNTEKVEIRTLFEKVEEITID